MNRRILALAMIVACSQYIAPAVAADAPLQLGYSVEPLSKPVFSPAEVAVETTALNNWLNANITKLAPERMSGPREHLYYLIDSRIKHLYAEEGSVVPKGSDLILELLFSWSEQLGVFGGAHAFNSVKSPTSEPRTPTLELPAEIELSFSAGVFTVKSYLGWGVTFPYYFMFWNAGDFTATNGQRTQMFLLSTGAAKDKSQLGHSQATLMLIFSPDSRFEDFQAFWLSQFEIPAETATQSLDVRGLQSRHVTNDATKLHKEFTAWQHQTGSYAVFYSGMEGTYEWNRPHFLDFLRHVETQDSARPN